MSIDLEPNLKSARDFIRHGLGDCFKRHQQTILEKPSVVAMLTCDLLAGTH